MLSVQEGAAKAADLLETYGFCQDQYYVLDGDGSLCGYCSAGAVGEAYYGRPESGGERICLADANAHMPLVEALADHVHPGWRNETITLPGMYGEFTLPLSAHRAVFDWNDASERTAAEVIAAFRAVAEAAK